MSSFPPTIGDPIGGDIARAGIFGRTDDTAKYLISRRRFERPTLSVPGGPEFEWPLGVEGCRIYGTASLAEHLFIGDNAAVLQVMHKDNRRIEMSGIFPGSTGSQNMRDLLDVIVADGDDGKILTLPAVIMPKNQVVQVESYDFTHGEDDRTDSWVYSITLRRQGVSGKARRPLPTIPSPANPKPAIQKAKSARVFTVRNNVRTLRAVAKTVYGNITRWNEIYDKNYKALNALGIPFHMLATNPLPLGMKLNY